LRRSLRSPLAIATALLGVVLTIALLLGEDSWKRPVTEPGADASYYYVYLPSLMLDGDLDFGNQYEVTKNYYRWGKTPIGRPANPFGIGPAILQLPAFAIGHGLAVVTGDRRDGFSGIETTLVLWTGVPCLLGAILLAFRLAKRRFGAAPAYLGAVLAAAAGPALYYAIRQPGYAHPYATLFATWLIERWDASYDKPRTLRVWITLGALAGAAALARPQVGVWALLLPVAVIDDLRKREAALPTLALRWAAGLAACVLVFAPQLVAWKSVYGAWYVVPQGEGFMRWDDPAWSETLFSSRNGLFPWSPLYAPMLLGVIALARDGMRLPLALLLGLFAQAEINGAAWDWWAGGSYGGRRFDSTYVLFAVGAAALIAPALRAIARGTERRARVRDRITGALAGLGATVAILVAIANVELTMGTSVISARITGGAIPSKVWEQRIGGARGWLAGSLAAASTLPVRAKFAWQHGVDLDAYDRLVGVHALGELFPPLVGDRDKRTDRISVVAPAPITQGLIGVGPNRARLTDGHAIVRFGINRVDRIAIRIAVETSGRVVARWNDQLAERTGTGTLELGGTALRGVNTLELEAPPGTIVSPIELTVVR
jgi:hypothetical protein